MHFSFDVLYGRLNQTHYMPIINKIYFMIGVYIFIEKKSTRHNSLYNGSVARELQSKIQTRSHIIDLDYQSDSSIF